MRKSMIAIALALAGISSPSHAGVGVFVGVSYAFGAGGNSAPAINLMATTSRRRNRAIGAVGVAFYPTSTDLKVGIPVGIGYQGNHVAGLAGYDFLQDKFFIGAGYANTRRKSTTTSVTPPQDDTPPPNEG